MASHRWIFILLAKMIVMVDGSHFRGGTISWRALNTTPSGTTAQILLTQRYAWRRSFFSPVCTAATISGGGLISAGTGNLVCFAGGNCGNFTTIPADVYCTDFSASTDYSLGARVYTYTLPLNSKFVYSYTSSAWLAFALKGGGTYIVTGQIELTTRPDGFLNTSPVTSTLPVFYRTVGVSHVHVIQMSDAEGSDTLRCRWSTSNTPTANANTYDECGSVCAPTLPTFTLYSNNCTLVYTITALNGYYAVALQIEDFYTSTSATPMSSVPIQFLFYGVNAPGGCSTAPSIIGVRSNLACIGIPIGVLNNETVIAQVGCTNKTITEFITSSPIGLTKTAIFNPSTGIFTMNLLFTPTASQYGPQDFCAAAIDSTNVQSDPWCITFLVGFGSPNLQYGSASPVGTMFANQSIFSIQSQNALTITRPGHNGSYVYFNDATLNNTVVLQYDCGWSPNVNYSGSTMIIYAPFNWVPGHFYYITFDGGAATGTDFCHAESAPITNPNFWQFDIWNISNITTTTTTVVGGTTTTGAGGTTTTVAGGSTTAASSGGNTGGQSSASTTTASSQDSSIIGGIVGGAVGFVVAVVCLVGFCNYLVARSKRAVRPSGEGDAKTSGKTFSTKIEDIESSTNPNKATNPKFGPSSISKPERPANSSSTSKVNPTTSYNNGAPSNSRANNKTNRSPPRQLGQ